MKRSMCGGILLASLAGMLACSGDPTGDLVGKNLTIQSDPTSLFVSQGESKALIVTLVDEQGNQQAIENFSVAPASGAVGAVDDTTYQPTFAGELPTTRRVVVTGTTPAATTVTLTANGVTKDVPVTIGPVSAPVTLSANAVPANVPITITLGAGYKFNSSGSAQVAGVDAIPQSVAPDGSAITVLPPPGTSGPLTVSGVAPDFAPTLSFDLPTGDTVSVDSLAPAPGTGAPSTAPALIVPGAGATSSFFDIGTFTAPDITGDGGVGGQYYKLDVTEAGTYNFSVNWDNTSDVDILLCQATDCSDADFMSSGVDQPEADSRDLVPGTYYLAVVLFAGSPPGTVSITLSR
jgi:hypothetical protein